MEIPAERYIALYAGHARDVYAMAEGGLSVQFPGSALREFVTHEGVSGSFDLHFDKQNRLIGVKRID